MSTKQTIPSHIRKPSILKPYCGPTEDEQAQDIFICLRPRSNGILVESKLLQVIEADPDYKTLFKLVYMANLPGDFMTYHRVVERHYALRLHFAIHGITAFTDQMKVRLENWLGSPIDSVAICGAFEALDILSYSVDELFNVWVAPSDMLKLNGQSVKRIKREGTEPLYVINYDIPALLHMNYAKTDIAVMVFRTWKGCKHFSGLAEKMKQTLIQDHIIAEKCPANRIVHISKSPCEELIDGSGHLYTSDFESVPITEINFGNYLFRHGKSEADIREIIEQPIVVTSGEREKTYFELTCECTYAEAFRRIDSVSKKEYLAPKKSK